MQTTDTHFFEDERCTVCQEPGRACAICDFQVVLCEGHIRHLAYLVGKAHGEMRQAFEAARVKKAEGR